MNKKIARCENQEFLPQEFAGSERSKRLNTAQKNLLGTLCFYYLSYSIYAAEHNGWFFKDQETLYKESNLSPAEGKRVMLKLIFNRLVERIPGTNHRCTSYRLCKEIRDLMPQNPETEEHDLEEMANEPLDQISTDSVTDTGLGLVTVPISVENNLSIGSNENEKRFRDFDVVEDEIPDEESLSEYLSRMKRKGYYAS